ncbi:hypothetical protein FRC06_006004 [Ceratobasidium sp. 370]|nr:hypothetical protein FRC06_006004 [Ceratobasidium sp. 370]
MSPLKVPKLLGLPQTRNGHTLAYSLVASLVFSIVQVALTAPSGGFWQMFTLISVGPVTFIHHIIIFCLLRKHRSDSSYVHNCLTRKTNIGFLVLFEAVWISGTVVGLYYYSWLHDSSDDWFPPLALASDIFGLLECLALGVVIVFCGLARREKLMDLRGVHEIGMERPKPKHRTVILAGYCISKEDLKDWSDHKAKTDEYYRRGLEAGGRASILGVKFWLQVQKLDHLIQQQHPPEPEHGGCDFRCPRFNYIFYRRRATIWTMAKFRSADWARLVEKPSDIEVKEKLEAAFGFKLSRWTVVLWGPRGMVYDPTPDMFEAQKDEIVQRLENGPPGPCLTKE